MPVADVGHEVLVVDNNSTDATAMVVEEARTTFPYRLRLVCERNQGLSFGRNRAFAESDAEVVALLDDDVFVEPQWLHALCEAFRGHDAAAVGGRAYLLYPAARPEWISDSDEIFLSKVDLGPNPVQAAPGRLFGLNLAIKRSWLDRVGPFRTDLDRIGTCLLSGGEVELLKRIDRAGGALWYEPRAAVGHRVAPERLTRDWFLKRHYWAARTSIRVAPEPRRRSLWRSLRGAATLPKLAAAAAYRSLRHGRDSAAAHERRLWLTVAEAQLAENLRAAIAWKRTRIGAPSS